MNGVKFYVLPDWSKLMEAQVSVTLVYKISWTKVILTLQFEGQTVEIHFGRVTNVGAFLWEDGVMRSLKIGKPKYVYIFLLSSASFHCQS